MFLAEELGTLYFLEATGNFFRKNVTATLSPDVTLGLLPASKFMPNSGKNLVLAISLSSLCFFKSWSILLDPSYFGSPPAGVNALALMLDVLAGGGLLYSAYFLVNKFGGKYSIFVSQISFLLLTVLVIKNLQSNFIGPVSIRTISEYVGRPIAIVLLVIVAIFLITAMFKWFPRVLHAAKGLILVLAPLTLILFAQASWLALTVRFTPEPDRVMRSAEGPQPEPERRVVWIIFDELDFHYAFKARPRALELPFLDGIAGESLFAINAYPPSQRTITSLPALFAGKLVSEAKEQGQSALSIRFADSETYVDWREVNILRTIKESGGNTALVGWYHPYCRVFKGLYSRCYTDPAFSPNLVFRRHQTTLLASMWDYFERILATLPVFERFINQNAEYVQIEKSLVDQSKATLTEKSITLTILHLPMPHPPYVYDRETDTFGPDIPSNYFDSLFLTDKVLGDIRGVMEKNGTWNGSNVIVSSDHWWRKELSPDDAFWSAEEEALIKKKTGRRIPFIFKPAEASGERSNGLIYEPEFNTVLTHDLILEIFAGSISSSKEAADWLDRHRSVGKVPY